MKVNILGTEYKIYIKSDAEEAYFKDKGINGYCDSFAKEICIRDLRKLPGWKEEKTQSIKECMNDTLRHEIIHAFLDQSGLRQSSLQIDEGWAHNEEMVDFFALQFPKILEAFKAVDAL